MNITNQYGMAGFWDDNLEVPTIYLDNTDTTDVQATDTQVTNTPITDARDAWAQGIGTPAAVSTSASSDWSLKDILSTGRGLLQDFTRYKATSLPGGQRIYGTIDPRTGLPVYGGGNINLAANSNMPLMLLGIGAVAVLMMSGKKSKR